MTKKKDTPVANNAVDLRAMLRDRQTKQTTSNTIPCKLALNTELLDQVREIEDQIEAASEPFAAQRSALRQEKRLGGPDFDEIDAAQEQATAELTAARDELLEQIKASTIVIVFKTISPKRYNAITAEAGLADGRNSETLGKFNDLLMEACFDHVNDLSGNRLEGWEWSEIEDQMSPGEWDNCFNQVFNANRRRVDLPFLSKS